jgi:hypothetical protein
MGRHAELARFHEWHCAIRRLACRCRARSQGSVELIAKETENNGERHGA